MVTRNYFAELYVAGKFADAGWNIYFPHRDEGFDFIVSKSIGSTGFVLRPVQVKGRYPTSSKGDKKQFGYAGDLTQMHQEMVLAIPYFRSDLSDAPPSHIAYMPRSLIRPDTRGFRCLPASIKGGVPKPRRDYARFFDKLGLKALESPHWCNSQVASVE